MSTGSVARVKSADRTVELLELLAASPARRTLLELARDLEIPKSSMHGLLHTLVQRGWVEADSAGPRYGLGVQALRTGAAYLRTDRVVLRLTPIIDRLRREHDATVQLGRLVDGQMVALVTREKSGVHPALRDGWPAPAHSSALGRILLARLYADPASLGPSSTIRDVPSRADFAAFGDELAWTRARGHAVDQTSDGYCCVAVEVPPTLSPYDAIGVCVREGGLPESRIRELASAVSSAIRDGLSGPTDQRSAG